MKFVSGMAGFLLTVCSVLAQSAAPTDKATMRALVH